MSDPRVTGDWVTFWPVLDSLSRTSAVFAMPNDDMTYFSISRDYWEQLGRPGVLEICPKVPS